MRTADTPDHGMGRTDLGALAQPVRPGAGGIDDPGRLDALFLRAYLIPQEHTHYTTMADVHGQHLGMIASHRARFHGLDQPFRHQALGEFTLCVFVAKNRPASARVEKSLEFVLIFVAGISAQPAAT